ncbi:protein kinase domain-containing protein [Paenibacillus allorhizoplanae]|nr:hypothetical protein [Paenibacillus allorhizoplanae]
MLGETLTVKKKLGEGGQGAVFLVEGLSSGMKALKWYNPEQSTEVQKSAIRTLIHHGTPSGQSGSRFVWPLDLVVADGTDQFGYIMDLIDTSRFAELGEVWNRLKPAPSMKIMCQISYNATDSYRKLHLEGFCYRDISKGNIMFDSKTGEVLICDNDNIGVNMHSDSQVWGTMEYMAPELVTGKANPSTDTDLHSLAVLLFQLWVWHHPMHGQMEYDIRSWDLPAKRKIYGEDPVFIFDPHDKRNGLPNDPDYATARKRWACMPKPLQEKFIHVFSVGLKDPKRRVTEGEWRSVFQELEDCIVTCPHDSAENFWYEGLSSMNCWYCGREITEPPRLLLKGASGRSFIVLTPGSVLKKRHIDPFADLRTAEEPAGQLAQNPNNPSVWGLRNLTTASWQATVVNEGVKEVPPQRAIPLSVGLRITFGHCEGELLT